MSNLDFIVAKVRGMRGKLYEGDALRRLCDMPALEDLAAALAPGQPVGSTIALQRHLTQLHVTALSAIATWLDGWEGEMFAWMLRRYQVENLKIIVRAWATKAGESLLSLYTVRLPEQLDLPAGEMVRAQTAESLLLAIPEPRLREGALAGLGDFEQSGRPFFVEAGIDRAYFARLWELAEQGSGEGGEAVRSLVRLELDAQNVMFVLRALFNYSLSFNRVRPFLAPFGSIGARTIEQIRSAPDIEAAAAHLPEAQPFEAVQDGRPAGRRQGDEVELALWDRLYHAANRVYYSSTVDFGAVVAFCYIKRVELANLIRISECIRYGERGEAVCRKLMLLKPVTAVGAG